LAAHPLVASADVINLHWTSLFQSVESLQRLLATGKPAIWTLHDMWPFTGGCHYAGDCEGFTKECRACPQLGGDPAGAASSRLQSKIAAFSEPATITAVSPSNWLAQKARRSAVFSQTRVEVIPNSVDMDVFRARPRPALRKKLGIPDDAFCILFGANDLKETRKGFDQLYRCFHQLKCVLDLLGPGDRAPAVHLLCFGRSPRAQVNFPMIALGEVGDEESLAEAYAAADVFALPSLEDNLPNTALEAMSSGLPVVSFSAGGLPELVDHGTTGFLATPEDCEGMAKALLECACEKDLRIRMGRAARERAERDFHPDAQARAYIRLYEQLVAEASGASERRESRSRTAAQSSCSGSWPMAPPVPEVLVSRVWDAVVEDLARRDGTEAAARKGLLDAAKANEDWAVRTEAMLATEKANAEAFRSWAESAEGRIAEAKHLAEQNAAWAKRSEGLLASERAKIEQLEGEAAKAQAERADLSQQLAISRNTLRMQDEMVRALAARATDTESRLAKFLASSWVRAGQYLAICASVPEAKPSVDIGDERNRPAPESSPAPSQSVPDIEICICAHNPASATFVLMINSLARQSRRSKCRTVLLVDNASNPPISEDCLSPLRGAGISTRLVREPVAGLSRARLTAIRETSAEWVLFVDDDNELDECYVEQGLHFAAQNPDVGCFGGKLLLPDHVRPPKWTRPFLPYLGIRDYGDDHIIRKEDCWGPWEPAGAGCWVHRRVLQEYGRRSQEGDGFFQLGRLGANDLASCDDSLMMRGAARIGLACAYVPTLTLKHHIGLHRFKMRYLLRLLAAYGRSHVILQCLLNGPQPIPHYYRTLPKFARLLIHEVPSAGRQSLPFALGQALYHLNARRQHHLYALAHPALSSPGEVST
jgi:glycosyltransferase involved in cell wall biosynthesis